MPAAAAFSAISGAVPEDPSFARKSAVFVVRITSGLAPPAPRPIVATAGDPSGSTLAFASGIGTIRLLDPSSDAVRHVLTRAAQLVQVAAASC